MRLLAIRALTDCRSWPGGVNGYGGLTFFGARPRDVVRALRELPIRDVGANCSVGAAPWTTISSRCAEAGGLPVGIKPNAGLPRPLGASVIIYCLAR